MPEASLPRVAKGSSMVVKTPPLRRKPWGLPCVKVPTICPASLMPNALVLVAKVKGSSMVVKVPPLRRYPCVPLASS